MKSKKNSSSALQTPSMKSKKQRVERVEACVQNHPNSNSQTLSNFNMVSEENLIHNINGGRRNLDFLNSLPPGYKFLPTEEELIMAYLRKKVMNEPLEPNPIVEAEVYQNNPEQLSKEYKSLGEKECYFFSPRDRRHPNGIRPNRSTQDGYWNASGPDQSILSKGILIGNWRTLVFYEGKRGNSRKTGWIMREYTLVEPSHKRINIADMKLDDWVLCKIYKNAKSYKNGATHEQNNNENEDQSVVQEANEVKDSGDDECETDFFRELFPEISESQSQIQPQYNDNSDFMAEPIKYEPPKENMFTELMESQAQKLNKETSNIDDNIFSSLEDIISLSPEMFHPQPLYNNINASMDLELVMEPIQFDPSSSAFEFLEWFQPQHQHNNVTIEATQLNPCSSEFALPELSQLQSQCNNVAATMLSKSNPFSSFPETQSDMTTFDNFGILPEPGSNNFASTKDYI